MDKVRFRISMSLDGFTSGPEQSVEAPLGIGGEDLHDGRSSSPRGGARTSSRAAR